MQENTTTILLADDNTLVRQTTRNVLEALGFNIYEAENGDQALELFRLHPDEIDILISDVVMPAMDGVRLANEIRCLQPDLPIILATGFDREAYLSNIGDKVRMELIVKPYRIGELAELIRRMLND